MAPAIDMSLPRPPFFGGPSGPGSTKSNPSSLNSFSLKGRKSFISGLLARSSSKANLSGEPTKPVPKPKDVPAVARKEKALPAAPTTSSENTAPVERKKTTHRSNEPQTLQPNAPHSLIRRISTTFRKPSDDPPNRVPHPTASSRHLREAALRERGLLPVKDLSSLEREQDRRLSIVCSVPEAENDGFSAADQIKQEWESRNRSADAVQRERMASFRFGGTSSPTTSEHPRPSLDPVVEVESPLASPVSTRSEKATPLPPLPTSSSTNADPALDRAQLPSSPSDSNFKALLVPLPPSPTTKKSDTSSVKSGKHIPQPLALPPSAPLPPLPSSPPASPRSIKSIKSDASTPKGVTPRSASSSTPRRPQLVVPTEPLPHSPTATTASPTSSYPCTEDGSLAPPSSRSRSRSRTVPGPGSSESDESSIATPSLDTSSQVTLDSGFSSLGTNKSKPTPLAKTWTNERSIPVIVESPVEDNGLIIPINTDPTEDSTAEFGGMTKEKKSSTPIPRRSATADPNLATTTKEKAERRKSLNLFKRGNNGSSTNLAGGDSNEPKLAKSTSLSNFRRSVVGTLSRGGHGNKTGSPKVQGFDASHLPASPTVPASLASSLPSPTTSVGSRGRSAVDGRTTGVGPRPRQALSPTMHSRGSILFETNAIQDDETRRMTELAFLG